jgi:predicted metal-dependent hydrolase
MRPSGARASPGLDALEKELSDDYHRFTKTKSLRFNLAYAEGFEALTMNAIKQMMEPDGFGEDLSVFMQMVEWHFVEELEHRTVAFDVYDHVCGDYFYRLVVGIWAQWHFTRWVRRVTAYMLKMSPPPKHNAKTPAGNGMTRTPARASIRDMLAVLLPGEQHALYKSSLAACGAFEEQVVFVRRR